MAEPRVATKELIEQIFDGAAPRYDREGPSIFAAFGERLVERMDIAPGARVLDVATGTGAVLIPAAQCVGAMGSVVGIDLAQGMLIEAEKRARASNITNYQLLKMDAEHLDLPDGSFDAVACAFSLFMFPSMNSALREMHRVLKLGGRLGVSLFGRTPRPFEPGWSLFAEQAQAYGIAVQMPQRVLYDSNDLESLLRDAGFAHVETHDETIDAVYKNEEDWWAFQQTLGTRAVIQQMTDEVRGRFKEEYLAKLRPLFRADGLHLPVAVLYATARKE